MHRLTKGLISNALIQLIVEVARRTSQLRIVCMYKVWMAIQSQQAGRQADRQTFGTMAKAEASTKDKLALSCHNAKHQTECFMRKGCDSKVCRMCA